MTTEFTTIMCCKCTIRFGMDESMYKVRQGDHDTFYCPNGHGQMFIVENTDTKDAELAALRVRCTDLEEQLVLLKKERDILKKERDELSAELEMWRPRADAAVSPASATSPEAPAATP